MNLGYLDLTYIEGDVSILDLDHFVHMHNLREESDYSVSVLYGRKAIRLPNPALRLYSRESLTLQFDRMGEAHHSFTGPPRTHGRACMEVAQQTMTTPQAHPQEPQWNTGYGGGYSGHHKSGSYYPLTVTPSLTSEPEPLPLVGTLTDTLLWSGTSIMGLTRLSTWWKGSDDSSDG
jgi:hypothetical protein